MRFVCVSVNKLSRTEDCAWEGACAYVLQLCAEYQQHKLASERYCVITPLSSVCACRSDHRLARSAPWESRRYDKAATSQTCMYVSLVHHRIVQRHAELSWMCSTVDCCLSRLSGKAKSKATVQGGCSCCCTSYAGDPNPQPSCWLHASVTVHQASLTQVGFHLAHHPHHPHRHSLPGAHRDV
jgi:hypothetical protein